MTNASAVIAELEKCRDAHGLHNTADVVRRAKPKNNALHPHFTWDDKKAAHLRRLDEARMLIRNVYVENPADGKARRVFFNLKADRAAGGGYRLTTDVLGSAELRKLLVRTALDELKSWIQRYREIVELVGPVTAATVKAGFNIGDLDLPGLPSSRRRSA